MPNKSHKNTFHQGKYQKKVEIKNAIVEWILMNLSLGVSISSWEVIIKACNLNTELKQKIYELSRNDAISSWRYIFLSLMQELMYIKYF